MRSMGDDLRDCSRPLHRDRVVIKWMLTANIGINLIILLIL